ncbi:MAG: phosphatase PAP2 family protein [Gammaproteobacteria bacterium]|jgi:membrane-associated phospholipid phosphatase|nr:phosphatase PAP2 family protein [Gammaproteobacteria bacterium]MBU2224218.1 phosphatase PAP2 family protein [Gammaproteobacteria bacterium]
MKMFLSNRFFSWSLMFLVVVSMSAEAASQTEKNGDRLTIAMPLLAFGTSLWIEDDSAGSWQFAKSLLTSKLSTEAIKHLAQQQRPNGECCDSFPSGHSTTAFTTAAFVYYRYGWKYALPAAVAAGYVGYSRVESKAHYSRDVVAGAALGIASSYFFTTPYHGVSITPYANHGDFGLQFQGSF